MVCNEAKPETPTLEPPVTTWRDDDEIARLSELLPQVVAHIGTPVLPDDLAHERAEAKRAVRLRELLEEHGVNRPPRDADE